MSRCCVEFPENSPNFCVPLIFVHLCIVATRVPGQASLTANWLGGLAGWTAHLGWGGILLFIGIYVLATLCFLPSAALKFGAGFAFGMWRGVVIVAAGSMLGAVAAFHLARRFAREPIRGRLAKHPFYRAANRAIERRSVRFVLLVRLCPPFPVASLNYLFGLTTVPFWPFFGATLLGTFPGTLLYVYLGSASHAGLSEAVRQGGTTLWLVYATAGILAAIAVGAQVTRWMRQELLAADKPAAAEPPVPLTPK